MSIASESFQEVELPAGQPYRFRNLLAFKGNLAAIVLGGPTTSVDTFYIWVMRKYGKTES